MTTPFVQLSDVLPPRARKLGVCFWVIAFGLSLCAPPSAGWAGERPIDKTLWLTMPFSARSPNEQISRTMQWNIYFSQDGTAYVTDQGTGPERGGVVPPNVDSVTANRIRTESPTPSS